MSLECLSMRYGVEVGLSKVLYFYNLKEHEKEKGRYQLTLRREMSYLITCLWSNDRGWKNKYFLVRGKLVYGISRDGDILSH